MANRSQIESIHAPRTAAIQFNGLRVTQSLRDEGECEQSLRDPADCGLRIWIEPLNPAAKRGAVPLAMAEALADTVARLLRGEIVAIRGFGGFHLACDASNDAAVDRLRRRTLREGRPFAVMVRDMATARSLAGLTADEAELLTSPEAPIVLVVRDGARRLAAGIAPGLDTLGIMLPHTPLHRRLLDQIDRPLVMVSGHRSSEPPITDNATARTRLRGLVDALLLHDRDIAGRADDSVVRFAAGRPRLLRRARGYAEGAIALPPGFEAAPAVLAFGGELDAVFCLVQGGAAIPSPHLGDLEGVEAFDDYRKDLARYAAMYEHRPQVLAADLHPEYLSTQLAHERAAAGGVPLVGVQHHHAHIASCMIEHGVPRDAPAVLGVVLDGVGLGDDGTLWGGEFLIADYRGYRRAGAFPAIALAGGVQAIREPWRNTYCHLVSAIGWSRFQRQFGGLDLARRLADCPVAAVDRMLERGINVPLASSCGRLFDAVAAAVGLCFERARFDGHGAMALEAAAAAAPPEADAAAARYAMDIVAGPDGVWRFDPAPLWWAIADDLAHGRSAGVIAARFHRGLARSIVAMVRAIAAERAAAGRPVERVVLSGDCFQNKRLLEDVVYLIDAEGLACLSHSRVPSNDGGLALGQAAVAAARWLAGDAHLLRTR